MTALFQRTIDALERGRRFVAHDVWHLGRPGEEIPHGFVIKHVRVAILLFQNIIQDDLLLRASALTFATVLALVPFLAMMFFVIQTFHLDENLYDYLTQRLLAVAGEQAEPDSAASDPVQEFLRLLVQDVVKERTGPDGKLLENPVKALVDYAKRGSDPHTLGWVGALFVICTVFGLMMNIESSFNRIWGVKRSRSWYRIFSDYVMILLFLPFLALGVLSVTVVLALIEKHSSAAFALRGLQFVAIWLAFAALYLFLPNTKVRFRYALIGGVVAGTLWSLAAWGYVRFQLGLPSYSLVYSASAQFPLLLIWIYLSWLILLLGAELSFAYQNEKTFAMERLADGASHAYREAVGLRAMVEVSRRFQEDGAGLTPEESAKEWNVPTRLINDTLDILEKAGLVLRAAGETPRYQPARSPERITVGDVVTALRESGHEPSLLRQDEALTPIFHELSDCHGKLLSQTIAQVVKNTPAPSAESCPPEDVARASRP